MPKTKYTREELETKFYFHEIVSYIVEYKEDVRKAGAVLGMPNHERVTFKIEAADDILGMLEQPMGEKATGEKA